METNFTPILEQIKAQYQFQNDKELYTLLESLADDESKGVTYWDYIEVDTLLTLQKPKTNYPDETIFIAYHQICELYFKLTLQELEKIAIPEKHFNRFLETNKVELFTKVLTRTKRYIDKLTYSFDIMKDGLDSKEFGVFRKALLPSSGFQTYQFRLIEILLTPYHNLIREADKASAVNLSSFDEKFDKIYWRRGAIEKDTNKAAKILVNFNNKYDRLFKETILNINDRNIYSEYLLLSKEEQLTLQPLMFELDKSILMWKLSHFVAATRHLPQDNKGTGGTRWDEYLPIKNQKVNYFPEIWKDKNFNAEVDTLIETLKIIMP